MPALRIAVRILKVVALVTGLLFVLAGLLGLAAVVVGRTEWGRLKLLALTLPRLQASLGGPLTVSHIEGDLLGTLIVYDFALDDAEGNPAIRARRLAVHFAPLSLVHGTQRVVELRGEGVWLALHVLHDGRFNLATLAAPHRPGDPPPPPLGGQTRFIIDHAIIDLAVRYQSPSAPAPIRVIEAALHVECAIDIEKRIVIALRHVDGAVLPPLASPLHASGRLVVTDGQLSLEQLTARMEPDEALLSHLFGLRPISDRLGPAIVDLRATGPVAPIEVEVQARFARTGVALDGAVTLGSSGIGWRGTAERRGATLTSTGQFDWDSHGALAARLDAEDLSRFTELDVPVVSTMAGRLRADVTVSRSAQGTKLDGALQGTALVVPALHLEHVDLLEAHFATVDLDGYVEATARGVQLASLRWSTVSLSARGKRGSLVGTLGAVGPEHGRIELAFHGAPIWSVASAGEDAHLLGADAEVTSALSVRGVTWRSERSGHLRFDAGRVLRVDDMRLASGAQRLDFAGSWAIAGGRFDARLRGDRLDLQQLAPLMAPGRRLPVTALHIDVRARGTTDSPILDGTIEGTLAADASSRRPGLRGTVHVRYAGRHFRGDVRAAIMGATAGADGKIGPVVTAGWLAAVLEVQGTQAAPVVRARLDATALSGAHFDRLDVSASGGAERGRAWLDGTARLRGTDLVDIHATSRFDGIAPLGVALARRWREIPVVIAGQVRGYPLGLLPEVIERASGLARGEIEVDGPLGALVGTAHVQVPQLKIGEARLGRLEARARFDGARVTAAIETATSRGALRVEAVVPLAAGAPLRVEARLSDFPFALSSATLPGLRSLAGTITASVDVGGTRDHPIIAGRVRGRDCALALVDGPFPYTGGTFDVSLKDEEITVHELSFGAGSGSVEIRGAARLAGLVPAALDLQVRLGKYPLSLRGVNLWLDGRADVKVTRSGVGWSGQVVIVDGMAQLDSLSRAKSLQPIDTPIGVTFVDAAGRRETAANIAPAARAGDTPRPATVSHHRPELLRVIAPGSFRVQGKEVATVLKGDLSIAFAGAEPRISGAVTADGGWVTLLGRRYEIEHLRADFDGASRLDPELEVRIARNAAVTIVVEVQGRASSPVLIFSSRPPNYSAEQVMAMILAGDPGAGGPQSESQEERLVGALSGSFVGQLKDQLVPVLPLDVIKVDVARSGVTGQEDTRFEAGKYLTETLYLSYVYQLGTVSGLRRLNRNQLQLEYRFARQFDVQAAFGDNGVGALDLSWNYRF